MNRADAALAAPKVQPTTDGKWLVGQSELLGIAVTEGAEGDRRLASIPGKRSSRRAVRRLNWKGEHC
jgi:hypothetical protein